MSEHRKESFTGKAHKNVVYACFGCFSNTGIVAGLGSLEVVKELGLGEVAVGCLAALSTGVKSVIEKTRAAKKVITVDGCQMECARKVVEGAGFKHHKSIVLVRDIRMTKRALNEDIEGELKPLTAYISPEEVERTKRIIIEALQDGS